ncbi:hypothetical protein [Bacillus sp. SG-1]|uniref:hypothetical protein n=1 Tax=Bacillus sp. SG-1 TaxID=161544 RepID=UPI00015433B8|nr:hypothetical protein [Bacillus sp. SG-1]EDL65812.1 hypothetical protein BSG1_16190 [Bacillus sp. SG-1]
MDINIEKLAKEMPEFTNHQEASDWFGDKFQGQFVFKEKDFINEVPTYFYHIVKDVNRYNRYMNALVQEESDIDSLNTFYSYTTVSITEDGNVEISL